jgi:DNA-binding GntR family transcriptional regulator
MTATRGKAERNIALPEGAYLQLRRDLLSGVQGPGSTVSETAVALRFDIARPTARLAIERLVSEGLLSRMAHHSARVPALTRDDVVDLYGNRALIESAAAASLARHGSIPGDALAAHRELRALPADGVFAALDADFHRALVAAQPSPRLAKMHALLMGEVELCIAQVQAQHLLTPAQIGEQHQSLLDAILAGDADLAHSISMAHIIGARDRLVDHYDRRTNEESSS